MTIYAPTAYLSKNEKQLITLLAKLLLEQADSSPSANAPLGKIVLTDSEAEELIDLLEKIKTSERFLENAYFIEGAMDQQGDEKATKKIWNRRRKQEGKSPVHSTTKWFDFVARLRTHPASRAEPMEYDYFLRMEEVLLRALNINPKIISLVMQMLRSQQNNVTEIRQGKDKLPPGTIRRRAIDSTVAQLKDRQIPSNRIVGALTLFTDLSVLFTTRDWDTTGTLSAIAGACTMIAYPR